MTLLSQIEIQWLRNALSSENSAQATKLPAELVRNLYPELFNYGPEYQRVLRLGERLAFLQKTKPTGRPLPPELFSFCENFGKSSLIEFARKCELMDAQFVFEGNAAAVQKVTLQIHSLARKAIGAPDGFFCLWTAPLYAMAGASIYADHTDPGFEEARQAVEHASLAELWPDGKSLHSTEEQVTV